MIKKIGKYLLGGLAGAVLCGAVVGGVVSCSNGSTTTTTTQTQSTQKADTTKPTTTTTSNQTQTTQPVSKPTTSTNDKTTKSEASKPEAKETTPAIPAYQLQTEANTSAIAYKSNDTNTPTMIATNVKNYSELIAEPNNVVISVLGQPEAVINVKNDTTSKTAPNITLNLNPKSDFYKQVLNGAANLSSLNNLIKFSTTKHSDKSYNFAVDNMAQGAPTNSSWTFSLKDFVPTFGGGQYGNTSSYIGAGAENNGLTVLANLNTFGTDIHAKNPTATFTFTNQLDYGITAKNGKKQLQQVPFNLTIDLLPLVQFSNQHPTIQITNQKTGAGELTNLPKEDAPEFIYTDGMGATNYNYFESPAPNQYYSIHLPKTSVPYVYINAQNMIVVGTTN